MQVGHAVKLHSRSGAAGTVKGALKFGALGTVYTSSDSLVMIAPIIASQARHRYPLVVHVSSLAVDHSSLTVKSDMSQVYQLITNNYRQSTRTTSYQLLQN